LLHHDDLIRVSDDERSVHQRSQERRRPYSFQSSVTGTYHCFHRHVCHSARHQKSVLVDGALEREKQELRTYRCELLRFAASSDRLEYGLFRALLVLRTTEGILG
jgi:hypothetical protein